MKRVVLNRKNSLFVGNARRKNGGDPGQPDQHLPPPRRGPQLYLTQLLTNLPSARMSELSA